MKLKAKLLQLAILIIALFCTVVGVVLSVQLIIELRDNFHFFLLLLLIAIIGSLLLGYTMVYHLFKILSLIEKNNAFTRETILYVKKNKQALLGIGVFFLGIIPYFVTFAEEDDAPGLILVTLFICGIPWAIFVFAQIVEDLFTSAIDLKEENELTI